MIYINKSVIDNKLVQMTIDSNSAYKIVDDASEIVDEKSNIYLADRKDNYIRICPGTKIYRCCSYHNIDIMQGCPFDCAYCILQAYLEHDMIKVSTDTESITEHIRSFQGNIRLGSGELSDSLALDNVVPFTKIIVPIVNELDNIQFEFKTKSANISNLLNLNPKNIVVSFSLNPESIVSKYELKTASVESRINAAAELIKYGYKVGFHFDPVIYVENYKELYKDLIGNLTSKISEESIEFISISTFRAPQALLDSIKVRSKYTDLLMSDMIKSPDGKYRYYKSLRVDMLKTVYDSLRLEWKDVFIYFCMEHETVWESVIGYDPGDRDKFELLFNNSFFT